MCGIAGVFRLDGGPPSEELVARMTRAVAHRGPDDESTVVVGAMGLGHRRLVIIDPEGGVQPFRLSDMPLSITYNGELYNYRELRDELRGRGHTFQSASDTEVVLRAYAEWGDACVGHFRGMFAFALADERSGRLFLARDQLGIKPLLWTKTRSHFAFASEISALHQLPDLDLQPDLEAIDQYLRLGYVPAPRTALQGVHKLPAAHRMSVDATAIHKPERYWRVVFDAPTRNGADWLEELDRVIENSVRAHLVADVPFGAFLSGGIDSSLVVAYMSRIMDEPVQTFSIGFDDGQYDETQYANEAAVTLGTRHRIETVQGDAIALLPKLVRHYGEPFGDSSAIPTYHVSRLAREHVPMVLSGDGGDEGFAGYDSYRQFLAWQRYEDLGGFRRYARPVLARLKPGRYPQRTLNSDSWRFDRMIHVPLRRRLWRHEHRHVVDTRSPTHDDALAVFGGHDTVSALRGLDISAYLPDDILAKVDVAAMANGLEVRTPLADVDVIGFAARIPHELLIRRIGYGRWSGKLLLKELAERTFSSEFVHRPKMGFAVPLESWLAEGRGDGSMRRLLTGSHSRMTEYFVPAVIDEIIDSGSPTQVWFLLVLNEWLRQLGEAS